MRIIIYWENFAEELTSCFWDIYCCWVLLFARGSFMRTTRLIRTANARKYQTNGDQNWGVGGWYSVQMGIFWCKMTWWFSDQELRYICTDQCETKTLNCIVNCPSDDTNCISDCLREDTLCIEGKLDLSVMIYVLNNIFRLSMSDQLPGGMHGLSKPGLSVQG